MNDSDNRRLLILRNKAFSNDDDGFDITCKDHTTRGNRSEPNDREGCE